MQFQRANVDMDGGLGEMGIVALESGPDVSIGFIGSPPKWIAPSAALLMASLAHACTGLWKRVLNKMHFGKGGANE